MKKVLVFVFTCLIIMLGIAPANIAFAAELSDSIVLHLTENHTENQIVINSNLITNTGISAMTLELVYDNSVFEFVRYERGQALDKLDLISTNLSEDPTLPVKFNWFNQNTEVENDSSTGIILKLYFNLKSDSESGEYKIGFKYDPKGDIIYTGNNHPNTKSAIIDKVLVNLNAGSITDTEIKEDTEAAKTPTKDINVLLIVSIIVCAVAVSGLFIALLMIKIRKGNRRRKNWLKL